MDQHYNNIKNLIENNLVEVKKNEFKSNYHTLLTNFNIGKELIEAQGGEARAKYGNSLIKTYSKKLSSEYGTNYSYRNLWLMRQFYQTFPNVKSLISQLSWTHYITLLPIKDENKRNYYINSIIEHSFSVRDLKAYIKSNAYERLVNKDNIELKYLDNTLNKEINIIDMIKNPILITINKSIDKITEKALKKFILEQIEKTMIELGVGFFYGGNEVPLRINNKILKPDLIFFNVELNCYVIIELKLNELTIKDIGQIEFYVKFYDQDIKKPFHNPTIGITISKKIDNNVIKYNQKENISHTTYELIEK